MQSNNRAFTLNTHAPESNVHDRKNGSGVCSKLRLATMPFRTFNLQKHKWKKC